MLKRHYTEKQTELCLVHCPSIVYQKGHSYHERRLDKPENMREWKGGGDTPAHRDGNVSGWLWHKRNLRTDCALTAVLRRSKPLKFSPFGFTKQHWHRQTHFAWTSIHKTAPVNDHLSIVVGYGQTYAQYPLLFSRPSLIPWHVPLRNYTLHYIF